MRRVCLSFVVLSLYALLTSSAYAAVDSYRFLHVTIETPWYIFVFLLGGVFTPFILMIVLVWQNAIRKAGKKTEAEKRDISDE